MRSVCSLSGYLSHTLIKLMMNHTKAGHEGTYTRVTKLYGMWVWFGLIFMFSNFYRLDLHNKTCVAWANPQWNICKNRIENRTSPYVVMGTRGACFLIFELDTQVLPIVFIIECRVLINIWRCSPISIKHVSLWYLLFHPHRTTYQPNIGFRIRKRAI